MDESLGIKDVAWKSRENKKHLTWFGYVENRNSEVENIGEIQNCAKGPMLRLHILRGC